MDNFEPAVGVEMNGNGVVRRGTAIGLLEGAEWVGVSLRKVHWRGRRRGRAEAQTGVLRGLRGR